MCLKINHSDGIWQYASDRRLTVADEFYKGIPWEIGLREYINLKQAKEMNFYFRPLYKDASFLVDLDKGNIPDFSKQKNIVKINNVEFIPEYEAFISFDKQYQRQL